MITRDKSFFSVFVKTICSGETQVEISKLLFFSRSANARLTKFHSLMINCRFGRHFSSVLAQPSTCGVCLLLSVTKFLVNLLEAD